MGDYYINPNYTGGGSDGSIVAPYTEIKDLHQKADVNNIYIASGTTHNTSRTELTYAGGAADTLNITSYDAGEGSAKPVIQSYKTVTDVGDWIEVSAADGITPEAGSNLWWFTNGHGYFDAIQLLFFGSLGENGVSLRVHYADQDTSTPTLDTTYNTFRVPSADKEYDYFKGTALSDAGMWVYSVGNPATYYGTLYYATAQEPVFSVNGDYYASITISDVKAMYCQFLIKTSNRTTDFNFSIDSVDSEYVYRMLAYHAYNSTPAEWCYLEMKNCLVTNNMGPFAVPANLLDSNIHNNTFSTIGLSSSDGGIYFANSYTPVGRETRIFQNYINDVKFGRYWQNDGGAIYMDSDSTGLIAYDNYITGSHIAFKSNAGDGPNTFVGNLVVDCGLLITVNDSESIGATDLTVANNVGLEMDMAKYNPIGPPLALDDDPYTMPFKNCAAILITANCKAGTVNIYNNIIESVTKNDARNVAFQADDLSTVTIDIENNYLHNYDTLSENQDRGPLTIITLPQSNVEDDPGVNSDGTNKATSPTVGAGLKWWTGPNPETRDEPLSDIDTDIGFQSAYSPLHPKNL